jgi:hypothetical protein
MKGWKKPCKNLIKIAEILTLNFNPPRFECGRGGMEMKKSFKSSPLNSFYDLNCFSREVKGEK